MGVMSVRARVPMGPGAMLALHRSWNPVLLFDCCQARARATDPGTGSIAVANRPTTKLARSAGVAGEGGWWVIEVGTPSRADRRRRSCRRDGRGGNGPAGSTACCRRTKEAGASAETNAAHWVRGLGEHYASRPLRVLGQKGRSSLKIPFCSRTAYGCVPGDVAHVYTA